MFFILFLLINEVFALQLKEECTSLGKITAALKTELNDLYQRAIHTPNCPPPLIYDVFQNSIESFFDKQSVTAQLEKSLKEFNELWEKVKQIPSENDVKKDDFWKPHVQFLIHNVFINNIQKYSPETVNRFLKEREDLSKLMDAYTSISKTISSNK